MYRWIYIYIYTYVYACRYVSVHIRVSLNTSTLLQAQQETQRVLICGNLFSSISSA